VRKPTPPSKRRDENGKSALRSRILGPQLLCWGLALIPLGCLIYLVARYMVDVPFWDQWEFVPLLEKSYQGTLSLGDLWAQHNEHRIFFPKIIMLLLARASGWKISYELAVNILFGTGIFAALICQIGRSKKSIGDHGTNWLIPVVSAMVFSLNQWENWIWGWQMQVFLNVLAVVAGIVFLARPLFRWRSFLAASLFGIVATYSFASGIAYWPIGFLMLLFRPLKDRRTRLLYIISWLLVTAAVIASYLYDYHKPQSHPSLTALFAHPLEYLEYLFSYLGKPTGADNPFLAGLAGLVVLFVTSFLLLRLRFAAVQALLPYLAFSLYSVSCAMLTGVGRVGFGTVQASSPRYVTIANLFWISILALLYLLAKAALLRLKSQGRKQRQNLKAYLPLPVFALFALFLGLLLRASAEAAPNFRDSYERLSPARAELRSGAGNNDLLKALYPYVNSLKARRAILKKYHLSVFRDRAPGT